MKALFGGTFNPVHNGHIALARNVCQSFELNQVELIPSYQSVHRAQPQVSPDMRQQMLQIALKPYPELSLNPVEFQRQGPSYTVDTLAAIAADSQQPLCWLMGVDAFNGFADWHRPDDILQLANLIVCTRPQVVLQSGRFKQNLLQANEKLLDFCAGRIALFDMPPSHCSSSVIRDQLAQGETAADCLPPAVLEFIRHNHIYEY